MKTKYVGIIGAMETEIELLKNSMDAEREEVVSGMRFYIGTLCGQPTVLVRCGVGKVNAALCAEALILRFGVDCVVNTGVAGSLDAEINIGDIVVSVDAVQHDMDLTRLGYAPGVIPGIDESVFRADETLRRSAREAAAVAVPEQRVFEGRVASGDQFIADSASKRAIIDGFGAMCCEMEGAAIAQVCYRNKVPFVIIRAVSDKADESVHMSYQEFEAAASSHSAAIVRQMAAQA
jgi:adenosylhomocysteine nucleosidase